MSPPRPSYYTNPLPGPTAGRWMPPFILIKLEIALRETIFLKDHLQYASINDAALRRVLTPTQRQQWYVDYVNPVDNLRYITELLEEYGNRFIQFYKHCGGSEKSKPSALLQRTALCMHDSAMMDMAVRNGQANQHNGWQGWTPPAPAALKQEMGCVPRATRSWPARLFTTRVPEGILPYFRWIPSPTGWHRNDKTESLDPLNGLRMVPPEPNLEGQYQEPDGTVGDIVQTMILPCGCIGNMDGFDEDRFNELHDFMQTAWPTWQLHWRELYAQGELTQQALDMLLTNRYETSLNKIRAFDVNVFATTRGKETMLEYANMFWRLCGYICPRRQRPEWW
ncbi:hypothetical protein Sste5346_002292 [Sporothrix stenoceras]|uniref:Retrotransposon gag domain-containing protein n=1 Tax=Sporothrix stenoceras TaxID=5173 RepID=A0ABR3ZK92_9PEZI